MSDRPDLFAGLDGELRRLLVTAQQPRWIPPMLATLTHQHFSADGWLFERKLDGERCLAFCDAAGVRLLSRNQRELAATYPEIVDALHEDRVHDVVLDGEVVAIDARGQTSFSRLQRRMGVSDAATARRTGVDVSYYIFDLMHADGQDLRALPLHARKQLLRRCLSFREPLHFTHDRDREGEAYLEEACAHGWEGLIAKRTASAYVSARSTDWLKFKCSNEQELVIGGFTDPRGSRVGFGALLLGYHERSGLIYAGKVGTGFDTNTLLTLRARLDKLAQERSPFTSAHRIRERGVHWTRPELVAQVTFAEWTNDGLLRHPSYLGLRDDKMPDEVVRERPRDVMG